MIVADFEFRSVDSPDHARFKLSQFPGLKWERVIPLPYPRGHRFWDLGRAHPEVIEEVTRLARENDAPDWAFST